MLRATSGAFGPANITGGKVTGVSGVPYFLGMSAIPFIGLSSGSVAANGAISAITALPFVYPAAYCYFPANILATSGPGSTAGWYYCTFSSTVAGTAFLNSYTSGAPVIPASPTAVTAGQGAFTGVTGLIQGQTLTLPANSLGVNGGLRVRHWAHTTNSAGTKAMGVYWNGIGGTGLRAVSLTTSVTYQDDFYVLNTGVTNNEDASISTTGGVFSATAGAVTAIAIDTTAATTIAMAQNRNTATDNQVTAGYVIEVLS